MLHKDIIKDFLSSYAEGDDEKIELALSLMEARAKTILEREDNYSDLYIDPNVDIVNSSPQVIQQVKEEITDFLKLLLEKKTNNILQIGLGHFAATHFSLSLLLNKVTTIEYDDTHVSRYLKEIGVTGRNTVAHDGNIVSHVNSGKTFTETIINGDSTDENVISSVKNEIFDAVFIDGNHSYEYVKKDLQNYSPFVKEGGIVALHDANFEGERYGTPQVIREFNYDWKFISHSQEVGIAYFIK